ncbi:hypothetical protein [Streptomyces sp. NPDC058855]|uniref:hypothetical protein n=1 Tax=Streptomyces sp. NPDC058855 TaxID=3346651 RepID=UPI0036B4148C
MASHRKLRAAAAVCVAAVVTGPVPAAAAAAPGLAPGPAPLAGTAAPTPGDPFAGLTPDQIADRAVEATQSATSLRMKGRIVSDDQPLDVDLALNDRNDCTGRLKIAGGTAELRRADDITYMKGDETFWRASMGSQGMPDGRIAATVELLKGRWLKVAPGQPGSEDLGGICNLKALLDDLDRDKDEDRDGTRDPDRGTLTRGRDGKVGDTPVATLVRKKPGGETSTVSVSREGEPYILRTVKTGGDQPGSITLSDYDKPVRVTVPPPGETVDLAKLNRGDPA